MKISRWLGAFLFSALVAFPVLARAQAVYSVVARGLDYNVVQKTRVVNGTNCVSRYTELATELNYTNAAGQLVAASEQITLLPGGGAVGRWA